MQLIGLEGEVLVLPEKWICPKDISDWPDSPGIPFARINAPIFDTEGVVPSPLTAYGGTTYFRAYTGTAPPQITPYQTGAATGIAENTFFGADALFANTTGAQNCAFGYAALNAVTTITTTIDADGTIENTEAV